MGNKKELKKRYPQKHHKWGIKKRMFSVLLPPALSLAVDDRAKKLTAALGYYVSRSGVIEEILRKDSDLQTLETIQLNKERKNGPRKRNTIDAIE